MKLLGKWIGQMMKPASFLKSLPNKQAMQNIYKQISQSVTKSYNHPKLKAFYKTTSVDFLLQSAINYYVGSRSSPKNMEVVQILFKQAEQLATRKEEKLEIMYYANYLAKLDAIQTGDTYAFQDAQERLVNMAAEGHPVATYTVGKEMYKVGKNMLDPKLKKEKAQMIYQSFEVRLSDSVDMGNMSALYLLGCMFEQGDVDGPINYQIAFRYFVMAASVNNPFAFFKLSQYYKLGRYVQQNNVLYYRYLKKAAQLGVVEAMHNLATEYLEGTIIKPNKIKALAWFLHAGQMGFPHSKFNAAIILAQGTEDGELKPNIRAALVKLGEVQKQGQIDASQIIGVLKAKLQEEERQKQQKKDSSSRK